MNDDVTNIISNHSNILVIYKNVVYVTSMLQGCPAYAAAGSPKCSAAWSFVYHMQAACCSRVLQILCTNGENNSSVIQVSKEQFDKILDMCKQGEEQGAKLECGGKRLGDKGYYIEPTVFSNVQDDNIIATDEIFGPVQSILKWKTIDEVGHCFA